MVAHSKTALLRLLNHPNLVSLVDVVFNDPQASLDGYAVWEFCNKGTLNRLLTPLDNEHSLYVAFRK
jgi:hypothetical protein